MNNKPTREEIETWWRIAIRFIALPYDGSFKLMKESHLALLDENERLKADLDESRAMHRELQAEVKRMAGDVFHKKVERLREVVEAAQKRFGRLCPLHPTTLPKGACLGCDYALALAKLDKT